MTMVFAALGKAAGVLFANSDMQISVVTGLDGRVSITASANTRLCSSTVEASIAGVYTPAVFMLTNAGTPTIALSLVVRP